MQFQFVVLLLKLEMTSKKTSKDAYIFYTIYFRYFFGKAVSGVIHLQLFTRIKNADLFLCNEYGDVSISFHKLNTYFFFNDTCTLNIFPPYLIKITGEFQKSTPLNSSTILYENDIVVLAKVSDPSTGTTVVNSNVVSLKRDSKMKWTLEPKRSNFQPGLPFTTFVSVDLSLNLIMFFFHLNK